MENEANTKAVSGGGMGTRGNPPSDGLTASSALTNAVQRAVDFTAQKAGLSVADPTTPRLFPITLVAESGPAQADAGKATLAISSGEILKEPVRYANLITGTWHNEEPTCTALSPDKQLGAVGTYERLTRPPSERRYGGKLHVVDMAAKQEFLTLEATRLVERTRTERGPSKVLACLFLGSWRHVAAVTGSYLILWDVERGIELSRVVLPEPLESADLLLAHVGNNGQLVVKSGSKRWGFRIASNKPN